MNKKSKMIYNHMLHVGFKSSNNDFGYTFTWENLNYIFHDCTDEEIIEAIGEYLERASRQMYGHSS